MQAHLFLHIFYTHTSEIAVLLGVKHLCPVHNVPEPCPHVVYKAISIIKVFLHVEKNGVMCILIHTQILR